MNVIKPACRYGHGPMLLERGRYALIGIKSPEPRGLLGMSASLASMARGPDLSTPPSASSAQEAQADGRVFEVQLFRCPICGYLELFDGEL